MWEYTDKVRQHFLEPKNVGVIKDADAVGEVGSLSCGDALKLSLKLDENERIVDAKFQTFGCASAIASSSALTEMIIGKTLTEAEEITNQHIADYLGGLPKEKMHCSVMGRDALEKAIACYRGEAEKEVEGNIVCECFGVTDLEIQRAVRENSLADIESITNFLKAGGGCGNCHDQLQDIINTNMDEAPPAREKKTTLTNIQKIKLIEETIAREIKPGLENDGGDIELVDVDGNRVMVRLCGACASCKMAEVTLKDFVESKLRELVAPDLTVEEVE